MAGVLIVLVLALVAALVALKGLVLSYLWAWFIVPLGMGPISVPHAIGIAFMVTLFTQHLKRGDEDKGLEPLATSLAGTLAAWGCGYLVAGMM